MTNGLLLLGIAVDPIHAGAGRTPGVVDLPVQRDALGYPIIYASSVKGALKTLCSKRRKCEVEKDGRGRLICKDDCKLCCCLFGPEPGEGDKGASRLALLDLVPLALPAPSAEHGFVYLTSSVLLSRALLELEAISSKVGDSIASKLYNILSEIHQASLDLSDNEILVLKGSQLGGTITIGSTPLQVREANVNVDEVEKSVSELLDSLGGLAKFLFKRFAVAPASIGASLVERSLVRVTRVALRRDRKTVAKGALWTEEYLPYGTIFVSGVLDTGFSNEYCGNINDPVEALKKEVLSAQENVFYAIIGGKETIGKGLIKFVVA